VINKSILKANLLVFCCLVLACDNNVRAVKQGENVQRTISFSGFEWVVGDSDLSMVSPGQNYFSSSEENVWVDSRGRLHLKITNRNGNWYCAKVSLNESISYNKYVFYVSSRVDKFDKNVVGGLFTYLDDSNEIDIEFAKWGDDEAVNSQFAVQPAHHDGNIYRFPMDLKRQRSTHVIEWREDRIDFACYRGHHSASPGKKKKIISEWCYTGYFIPSDDEEKIMINLWLYKGVPPSDNREVEMIIEAFEIL
jgi:hypothetical protein